MESLLRRGFQVQNSFCSTTRVTCFSPTGPSRHTRKYSNSFCCMQGESRARRLEAHKRFKFKSEPKAKFPTGIDDHQNNSFDEFRKRGYARANHGRCVRSETARVWALFVLVQHIQESKETRSETIPA